MPFFAPELQSLFPEDDYTPFGYLHTPDHMLTHPSGVIRSVQPFGFGLYKHGLSWYGMDALNTTNAYISVMLPALRVNGKLLADETDFTRQEIPLVSRYHSSNILSYDFEVDGIKAVFAWYSDPNDSLFCRVRLVNSSKRSAEIHLDAAHVYGMNTRGWWGSDAITARWVEQAGALVSKILAYGDVFALGSTERCTSCAIAADEEQMREHREGKQALTAGPLSVRMPGPLYSAMEWDLQIEPDHEVRMTIALCRGVNEESAVEALSRALSGADSLLRAKVENDNRFCARMPRLGEGWPDAWRRGMVYHYQTLRMNVMNPHGIFTHRWDGMQTVFPRMVLGETCIDMLSLCYADPDTALEVLTTTFEDSPGVHVPCCREDGSVNMIGSDGSECATALMWGFPWQTIRTLLAFTGNTAWLKRLYPSLKKCVEWWKENRTDEEGWYHCNNSWESGQDGSKRFVSDSPDEACEYAMNADHVRAVDLESTMAQTCLIMSEFADILGYTEDAESYRILFERDKERVQEMFFEDRFRDVNALTGEPFMADAHEDPMLTMPLATGLADPEQIRKMDWILDAFVQKAERKNPVSEGTGLYWPPLFETLTRSLAESGRVQDAAHVVSVISDMAYSRDDSREAWPRRPVDGIPERFRRNIPGNARENLNGDIATSGTENYGWGCVGIALFGEYILGLRPKDALGKEWEFQPVLPELLTGEKFQVAQFPLLGDRADLTLERQGKLIHIHICSRTIPEVEGAENVERIGDHLIRFSLQTGSKCVLRKA